MSQGQGMSATLLRLPGTSAPVKGERDGDREGMRGNNEGSHLERSMKEERRAREGGREEAEGECAQFGK